MPAYPQHSNKGQRPMYRKLNSVDGQEQNRLLREFLEFMFPAESLIEIRPIPDRAKARRKYNLGGFFDGAADLISHLPNLIEKCKNANHAVFFGVLPRKSRENGKRSNCSPGRVIWSDIDDKDTGGRDQTWALVNALPIEPSAIVQSGGGLHIYYFLDREIDLDRIEDLNKSLLARVNGDTHAWDGARILRLPLSWHLKKDPVRVVFAAMAGNVYSLDGLEEMLGAGAIFDVPKGKKKKKPKLPKSSFRPKPILSANVRRLIDSNDELAGYFRNQGKRTKDQSASAYDWVFVKELSWLRVEIGDAFNALCAKIRNEGRDYDYVAEDGTEKKAKPASYIIKTVQRAYASLEEKPAKVESILQNALGVLLGDRDDYPVVKMERYPDDYSERFKRGKPIANLANCHMVIDALNVSIGDLIRFNEFTGQLEFQGNRIADHHITELRLEISWAYGVQFRKEDVGQMIEFIARREDNIYHPVREYLEKLES